MPLDREIVLALAVCGLLASLALGALYWRQTRRSDRLQGSLSAARSRASDAELRDAATGALSRRGLDDALATSAQRDGASALTVLWVGLRSHGLQAERFTCEITKSVAMEDTVVAHRDFVRLGRPRWRRLSALPFSRTPCRWPPATHRHK